MVPFITDPVSVGPLVRVLQEPRLPRQVVVVMAGYKASAFGHTDTVEIYNNVTNSWRTIELKLPAMVAYHGLILRGNQVSRS